MCCGGVGLSYSEREKMLAIVEQDRAIEEAGLNVVYVRLQVPSHAVFILFGLVIVVFGFLAHGV